MTSSSVKGNKSLLSPDPKTDQALLSSTPSWNDIESTLYDLQTPEEREFRRNLSRGYGVGSPLHKLRLYNESNKEQDVRVTLYRDSASWCPYCQKVWTMLEEKKIPYRVEKINMRCYGDKPKSFLQLQPSGNIPVAVMDGKVYGQSNDIMYALEETFPERSLKVSSGEEARGNELLRLERRLFSAWLYWLTGGGGKQEFITVLEQVESALQASSGPFFVGNSVTIVDLMFAPFLERMCASLLFFKGFMIRVPPGSSVNNDYPAVNQWFDAMETLDSYQLTKSDYYTHCWDLPPQLGGCVHEDGGLPYEQAINGVRRLSNDNNDNNDDDTKGSWELPLEPHNGGIEPDWEWAACGDAARREAVERLSANHENIVKFAARGAGRKGMPPAMAPLSDPNATPNEAVLVGVESVLRTVCMAMLEGCVDKHCDTMDQMALTIVKTGGTDYADGIIASLSYLRDRVGVPRDMKLPAARELRAHLNWAVGKILSAKESL